MWRSIYDDGTIMVSQFLSPEDARKLGVSEDIRITGLQEQHLKYLDYHQEHVFQCFEMICKERPEAQPLMGAVIGRYTAEMIMVARRT